jgi:hypothetical protein
VPKKFSDDTSVKPLAEFKLNHNGRVTAADEVARYIE